MSNDTTRDAFEKWFTNGIESLRLTRNGDTYTLMSTHTSWEGWQAATEQGKRQPLTTEQIAGKWRAAYLSSKAFTTIDIYTYFAREIEALHGITTTPQSKQIAGNLASTLPAYSKSIAATPQGKI